MRPVVVYITFAAVHLAIAGSACGWQATIGGRRVDLDATLSAREIVEENRSSKHERTLEQLRLRAAVALTDWLRFDSTATGANGGPTLKADRTGVYSWDSVFQDISPAVDFEEAYFDLSLPALDVRLGKQKVAWGKLDRTQPNDLVNPLNYSDPFLQEEADRKIGVPALQATYYVPDAWGAPPESRLTAVWVPQYVPYRFPLANCDLHGSASQCDLERWFPPAAVPPTRFMIPGGLFDLNGQPNPPLTVPLTFHTHNASPPAWRLENGEIGLRYAALVRSADVALYYFHGFDPQPAFDLKAAVVGQPDPTSPLGVGNLLGATTLSPKFHHIDSWGADVAYAFDRFTVRGEGAFVQGRPFSRDLRQLLSDPAPIAEQIAGGLRKLASGEPSVPVALPPSSVVHDAVEWGLGGDYVYEGYMLLLQVNETDVLHNDVDLLIKGVETRLLANLRKSFLSDTVQTQLVAVHAIESDYTLLRPRLLYRVTDNVGAEIGYLFIAGRAHSVVGQYRRNDEAFVRFEYKL